MPQSAPVRYLCRPPMASNGRGSGPRGQVPAYGRRTFRAPGGALPRPDWSCWADQPAGSIPGGPTACRLPLYGAIRPPSGTGFLRSLPVPGRAVSGTLVKRLDRLGELAFLASCHADGIRGMGALLSCYRETYRDPMSDTPVDLPLRLGRRRRVLHMRASDIYTVAEVFRERQYRLARPLGAEPTIVDAGANSGAPRLVPPAAPRRPVARDRRCGESCTPGRISTATTAS